MRSALPMLVGMALTFARRDAGRGRRRLGGAGQPSRPLGGAGAAGALRHDPAVSRALGPPDAAAGRARRAPVAAPRPGEQDSIWLLAPARRRHRPAVGAVRRADPRPDPHRRGAAGRQLQHHAAAARLRAGRGDLAGAGAAGRRQVVRAHEAVARRRRMDPPGARRAGARRRGAIALGLDTGVLSKLSSAQTASFETAWRASSASSRSTADSRSRGSAPMRRSCACRSKAELPSLDRARPVAEHRAADPRELQAARSCWSISGPTPASTACARSPMCAPGPSNSKDGPGRDRRARAGIRLRARIRPTSRKAVADLGISYPVALDNDYELWRALNNHYWPAHYFIDAQGRIRHHHFGEGGYAQSERVIRQLLAEAGRAPTPAAGAGQSRPGRGSGRGARRRSSRPRPISATPGPSTSSRPAGWSTTRRRPTRRAPLALNDWSLAGNWTIGRQSARSTAQGAQSSTASTPATCTSCSARRAASRCASGSRSTARRRAPTPASTSTPTAPASLRRTALSAGPPERRSARPHLRDRIPRPRRPGLCLYLWLIEASASRRPRRARRCSVVRGARWPRRAASSRRHTARPRSPASAASRPACSSR